MKYFVLKLDAFEDRECPISCYDGCFHMSHESIKLNYQIITIFKSNGDNRMKLKSCGTHVTSYQMINKAFVII
jgi:hypothetical protein